MEGTSRNYDFRMPFQVMFDRSLEVRPDEEYSLNAVLKVFYYTLILKNSNQTDCKYTYGFLY